MNGPVPFLIFIVLALIGLRLAWAKFVLPRILRKRHAKRHARWWQDCITAFEAQDYDAALGILHFLLNCPDCGQPTEPPQTMIGVCKQMQGEYRSAKDAFESALKLNNASTRPRKNLAYLLASAPDETLRDGARAQALANEAIELGPETDWEVLTILAAAQAESGDFDSAIVTYKRAMSMMPPNERQVRTATLNQLQRQEPIRCSPEFDRSRLVRTEN